MQCTCLLHTHLPLLGPASPSPLSLAEPLLTETGFSAASGATLAAALATAEALRAGWAKTRRLRPRDKLSTTQCVTSLGPSFGTLAVAEVPSHSPSLRLKVLRGLLRGILWRSCGCSGRWLSIRDLDASASHKRHYSGNTRLQATAHHHDISIAAPDCKQGAGTLLRAARQHYYVTGRVTGF